MAGVKAVVRVVRWVGWVLMKAVSKVLPSAGSTVVVKVRQWVVGKESMKDGMLAVGKVASWGA